MREDIFEKIIESIAANTNVPREEITINSTFEELGLDSLDSLLVINNLEKAYDITLTNENALKIKTVQDAIDSLEKVITQSESYAKK